MSVQRRKTEMVGSLVVPADMMSKQAAKPQSTKEIINHAVEDFGEDLKRSTNLQKRKTEMYGTLIVNAMEDSGSPNAAAPSSPGSPSKSRKNKWYEPMDEQMVEDMQDFLYGL